MKKTKYVVDEKKFKNSVPLTSNHKQAQMLQKN